MTDYAARKVAQQIDALNGDAPWAAVRDLLEQSAAVEVREAVQRFRRRSQACQQGDDLAAQRDHEDGCRGEHSPGANPDCWHAPMVAQEPRPPRCRTCGNPADDHPYRHPFMAREFGRAPVG